MPPFRPDNKNSPQLLLLLGSLKVFLTPRYGILQAHRDQAFVLLFATTPFATPPPTKEIQYGVWYKGHHFFSMQE
jgi:hypothetical protein